MRTEFLCVSVLRVASGPRVKLVSCKSALNPPVVYSTDRSKAVVPVLVLLFVALWFILWGDLLYVFPCVILFLYFSVLLVLRLPRFGKRELILVLFVRLFDLCLFGFVGFLFLLRSGKGCGLWLWHSLDFSLTFFCSTDRSKVVVPVLVLLFAALWFILRGDLLYIFPCVILFLCFSVLLVLRLPRLGKRELILVLFVHLFGLCLFGFVGFLFLLGSGKGCGLWLWHSLDFSLTFFCSTDRSKVVVPVLVLLFVALWFILRGDLLYIFPCVILFLCFSVLLVLRLPRLGKRELILVLVWICRFPLPLGVWEGLRFVIVALPGLFSYLSWDPVKLA